MISLIIPFYNGAQYLEELGRCLENQGVAADEFEVIFVDDCSQPPESAKLAQFVQDKDNYRLFRNQTNLGPGRSRNRGIAESKGTYLLFLDCDDLLAPGSLRKLQEIIQKETPDAILFDFRMDTGKTTINYQMLPGFEKGLVESRKALAYSRSMTAGKCYRRGLIVDNNVQFGSLRRHEDTAFTKSALAFCEKTYYLNQPLYLYLLREDGLISDSANASIESSFAALEIIRNTVKDRHREEIQFIYIVEVIISCMQKIQSLGLSRKEVMELFSRFERDEPGWYQNSYLRSANLRYRITAFLTHRKCVWGLRIFMNLEALARKAVGV